MFSKTTILPALVGYEMIIANSALRVSLAIYHLISKARSTNNCSIILCMACMFAISAMENSTNSVLIKVKFGSQNNPEKGS